VSEETIKVEYYYSEPEYMAASRLYLLSSPGVLARLIIVFGLILFAAILLTVLIYDFPVWIALTFTLLLEGSLLYNVLVRMPRQYFRGDAKFRDKYELTFSDEGIGLKTKQIESKLAWTLYTKVVEDSNQYLLIYGRELRMMTMVPKRAFESQTQEAAFRELLKRHIRDHSTVGRIKPRDNSNVDYTPTSLNPPDWR
jgi:YcxB-like protein